MISTVFDPRAAVAAMILPIIGSNFIQATQGGNISEIALRFRWLLIPMVVAGSIAGAAIITTVKLNHAALILELDKNTFIRAMGVTFLVGEAPLFIGLAATRFRPARDLGRSRRLRVGEPVRVFMTLGAKLHQCTPPPQKHFMTLVGAVLLIVGLNIIRRAVF